MTNHLILFDFITSSFQLSAFWLSVGFSGRILLHFAILLRGSVLAGAFSAFTYRVPVGVGNYISLPCYSFRVLVFFRRFLSGY